MTRYFPELVEAVKAELPDRCVIDGEIVIATDTGSTSRRCSSDPPRGFAGPHARRKTPGFLHSLRPDRPRR